MDTDSVVREIAVSGDPRPPRRRWLIALVLAAIAAPLASGSAAAVNGGGSEKAAGSNAAPAPRPIHHRNGRDCWAGKGDSTRKHRRQSYGEPKV